MKKGVLKSVSGNTLVLSHDGDPDTSHSVATDAVVTVNGLAAKLADLQAGDDVSLSGDPAKTVAASRP